MGRKVSVSEQCSTLTTRQHIILKTALLFLFCGLVWERTSVFFYPLPPLAFLVFSMSHKSCDNQGSISLSFSMSLVWIYYDARDLLFDVIKSMREFIFSQSTLSKHFRCVLKPSCAETLYQRAVHYRCSVSFLRAL